MFGKITLEVLGGTDINCAINEAIANARSDTKVVAKSHGGVWPRLVEFNFNNVVVTVAHDSDPDLLYRDWCRAMAGYIDKQVGPHPKPVLSKISNRIINEIRGINRVVYDISSKPPATIEWE